MADSNSGEIERDNTEVTLVSGGTRKTKLKRRKASNNDLVPVSALNGIGHETVLDPNGNGTVPFMNMDGGLPPSLHIKKTGPPIVSNQIGMGGLQSPVQVGGAGFVGEVGGKKTTSSRRRSTNKKLSTKGGGGRWTKEEDQKLRAAVAAVGPQNWKMIAQDFLGEQRSDVQCLHRWQKVLQPGLVKGPWTKEVS